MNEEQKKVPLEWTNEEFEKYNSYQIKPVTFIQAWDYLSAVYSNTFNCPITNHFIMAANMPYGEEEEAPLLKFATGPNVLEYEKFIPEKGEAIENVYEEIDDNLNHKQVITLAAMIGMLAMRPLFFKQIEKNKQFMCSIEQGYAAWAQDKSIKFPKLPVDEKLIPLNISGRVSLLSLYFKHWLYLLLKARHFENKYVKAIDWSLIGAMKLFRFEMISCIYNLNEFYKCDLLEQLNHPELAEEIGILKEIKAKLDDCSNNPDQLWKSTLPYCKAFQRTYFCFSQYARFPKMLVILDGLYAKKNQNRYSYDSDDDQEKKMFYLLGLELHEKLMKKKSN